MVSAVVWGLFLVVGVAGVSSMKEGLVAAAEAIAD